MIRVRPVHLSRRVPGVRFRPWISSAVVQTRNTSQDHHQVERHGLFETLRSAEAIPVIFLVSAYSDRSHAIGPVRWRADQPYANRQSPAAVPVLASPSTIE